jgi:invasion protein IalB
MIARSRLVGIATLAVVLAGPALAQPQDGQAFDDWRVRCGRPDESAPEQCHIGQTVVVKETGKPFLYVGIGYAANRGKDPLLFVTVPLGIHLPSGVTLQVESAQPVSLTVERCDRNGCHAVLALDDMLIASMRKGLVARFGLADATRQSVRVPISLKGFTAGLKALR